MGPRDNVKDVGGLVTSTNGYGVFYPYDGLLQGGYRTAEEAQSDIDAFPSDAFPESKDAYVVKISIERVGV